MTDPKDSATRPEGADRWDDLSDAPASEQIAPPLPSANRTQRIIAENGGPAPLLEQNDPADSPRDDELVAYALALKTKAEELQRKRRKAFMGPASAPAPAPEQPPHPDKTLIPLAQSKIKPENRALGFGTTLGKPSSRVSRTREFGAVTNADVERAVANRQAQKQTPAVSPPAKSVETLRPVPSRLKVTRMPEEAPVTAPLSAESTPVRVAADKRQAYKPLTLAIVEPSWFERLATWLTLAWRKLVALFRRS
ncbi:MAG: hypothetical protein WCV84_05635 [Patescibacteria group bacterium]